MSDREIQERENIVCLSSVDTTCLLVDGEGGIRWL
jgi:hypothetical protein